MDFGNGKILPVNLEQEMRNSYIDYAMSVIVSRALPDVRDGLKPVHRRILYAMQEAGMTSGKPYKKSARIVGEVLGKYHPHGDSSVYDAIVRMAQDFSMRYMLADGHGNFGSVDGDPAAAMRYTEVRMSKISELMLQDIDKDTVDFVPNYDESLKEPSVLPSKYPELLVNGTSGIAVGMATNIPPHNMNEVIDGVLMLIDNPDASVEELMTVIKGPDFPTGGLIMGTAGIRDAYTTGRGSVKMRAKAHVETMSNGKPRIVVTELPYQVNKARLIEKIADLAREKQIEGITDLRDESDRNGMSIVIELRKDVNPDIMLNQLYKHTQLQETFGVIMLALVDNQPRVLTLKEVLHYYILHQEDVITRRTRYELAKAEARAHILEGLTIALDHLDAVITTIRESQTADIARAALMDGFKLSEKQAQAILDLRLQRLTGLEREKIEEEYQEVLKKIEWLKSVLADESKIMAIIKEELTQVKAKFGDERRTTITYDMSEMNEEDLIADEDVVVTISHNNYIKRMKLDTYNKQNRGGQGILGMSTKEGDFVENILITTTHHTILFYTSRGRVYYLKAYQIAEASRQARGTALINLLKLEKGEKITAVLQVREYNPEKFLFMATKKGIVKKVQLSEFNTNRKLGVIALKLDDDDELIGVKQTDGQKKIVLGTRNGYAIIFDEEEVRPMGRIARGVKGIKLRAGDEVVGMDTIKRDSEILTVTAGGYGKRTRVDEYSSHHRGAMGIINLRVTEKTGEVVGLKVVREGQELMLISTNGIIIRTGIDKISVIGRDAQGVIIMKTAEDDKVASMAILTQKAE
ncbi:MAG: DNA gyrase subunit A [Anaerovibrio sp.]|uniref:DNA gyrase subunit A n=1 Tax=Anaerovibrio TaxID=82373 RepID=UPI0023F06135|nr:MULTISPECIES: DNA gyrase subunit A [Anaerovibrio]MBQ5651185.1 DNA gyrase subunit A [Selenomonadaceae bacterium]MBQ5733206.1 DNA gyrase subunit A [Selenomonadaceae bacterium]MBQ5822199.1 DNA gyrase subunit A [Selenomonadaceae bacterium]MBQ5847002.1 DNA gyrase subunit A [Selenomonadaceae bacterium]MBQ5919952.1 DNA gyrase subunit A [Selenomonadaceae bacterium]